MNTVYAYALTVNNIMFYANHQQEKYKLTIAVLLILKQ